jgi:transcriptional regulator with XRE-family HTH domain
MSPTRKQLAMKLKKEREAIGLTQVNVAKKARITRQYLYKLETGKADPTVAVLQRLAKALGVPVAVLLE